ncbi:MAG: helicase-related protein [Shewanella sp.]
MKEAKDIKETVVIPDIIEINQECDMSAEQSLIYEELRARADALSQMSDAEKRDAIAMGEKVDTTFGIIRDMDRVTTDMDLYNRKLTFVFPIAKKENVDNLVNDLPLYLEIIKEEMDDDTGKVSKVKFMHYGNPKLSVQSGGTAYVLEVHETYEDEVISRLSEFGIAIKEVSHPITPKYAKLIENLRTGLEDGKHIIFTEEKSQHAKLKRIIANSLALDPNVIAIINAETVASKKKRGDDDDDAEQGSLEEIAIKYNAGDYQILICNKKAEVGINLHIGTAAVHHLTLPWTPASIKQRNGRGARVGAKQKSINAIYYVGKGSFDEFRLNGLKRKAEWMDQLFNGTEDSLENSDADDAEQTNLLLAKDPEELAARIAATKAERDAKYAAATKQVDETNLVNFIKANRDLTISPDNVKATLENLQAQLIKYESIVQNAQKDFAAKQAAYIEKYRDQLTDPKNPDKLRKVVHKDLLRDMTWGSQREHNDKFDSVNHARNYANGVAEDQAKLIRRVKAEQVKLVALKNAEKKILQLRPAIEAAIKKGTIEVSMDVLANPQNYVSYRGRVFGLNNLYAYGRSGRTSIVKIESFATRLGGGSEVDAANVKTVYTPRHSSDAVGRTHYIRLDDLGDEQAITQTELAQKTLMAKDVPIKLIEANFSKDEFRKYMSTRELALDCDYVLMHSDSSFDIMSVTDLTRRNGEMVVYPTSTDPDLQKRLCNWLIENPEEAALDISIPEEFYAAILGDNWEEVYQQSGVQASVVEISKWAATTYEEWHTSPVGIREAADDVSDKKLSSPIVATIELRDYLSERIPTSYSNRSAFTKTIAEICEAHKERVRVIRKNILEKHTLLTVAAFKQALADKKDRQIRLRWLIKTAITVYAHSSMLVSWAADSDEYKKYSNGASQDSVQGALLADLGELNRQPTSVEGLIAADDTLANSFTNAIIPALRYFHRNRAVLEDIDADDYEDKIAAMQSEQRQAEISFEKQRAEAARSLQEQEQAKQALREREAELAQQLAANTVGDDQIKITTNTENLLNTKFGRWLIPAGEAYAINDSRGTKGRWGNIKDMMKRDYDAKYSVDINSQFQGHWWFVRKSKITLSKLTELLEIKNNA